MSERIPEEELQLNAASAALVYASPRLERVFLLDGVEAYVCPWDRIVLFRRIGPRWRLEVPSWEVRDWCEAGCNHFWVYVFRKGDPRALRVKIHGRGVRAILEGPSVVFVVASRIRGIGAPWLP